MAELVVSIDATASSTVEVVFYIDDDDQPSIDCADTLAANSDYGVIAPEVKAVVGPRIVMSDTYNRCAEAASGEILMECCDSVLFRTPGWDQMVEAEFAKLEDKILLVWGDDAIQHGRSATLPFLHRKWVEAVGYFLPPYFSCDWCDTWVYEVARQLDRLCYLPHMLTEHRHPVVGTVPVDDTYRERIARGDRDRVIELYRSKHAERLADAEKLREVMCR